MSDAHIRDASYWTGPDAEIHVSNLRGSIEVRRWDQPNVRVESTVETDGDAALLDLSVEHAGARVTVKASPVRDLGAWLSHVFGPKPPSVRFVISAPTTSTLTIMAISAAVVVEGIEGVIDVSTVSGGVTILGSRAQVRVKTVSGEAAVSDACGEVRFESVSGHLHVRGSSLDAIHATTVSGQVEVASVAPHTSPLAFNTVSGTVRLHVEAPQGFDAALTTLSGALQSNLMISEMERIGPQWRARLGVGGREVKMTSVSGSLEIFGPERTSGTDSRPKRDQILEALVRGGITLEEAKEHLDQLG